MMDEYLRRVYSAILENKELQELGEGVPRLLVEQAKTVVTMRRAVENVRESLHRALAEKEKDISKENPLLCGIEGWMKDQLDMAKVCRKFSITFY